MRLYTYVDVDDPAGSLSLDLSLGLGGEKPSGDQNEDEEEDEGRSVKIPCDCVTHATYCVKKCLSSGKGVWLVALGLRSFHQCFTKLSSSNSSSKRRFVVTHTQLLPFTHKLL